VRRARPLLKLRSTLGLTNTGAVKPFLSIAAARSGRHDTCNGSGALLCIINDKFIIQVHEGIPKKRPLLLGEGVQIHRGTEIARRAYPMKVSEVRTGGGGLAEITRRRRRRSPSFAARSCVSQIGRQMAHESCLSPRILSHGYSPPIRYEWRRGGPKNNTYSQYECVRPVSHKVTRGIMIRQKIRNTTARWSCSYFAIKGPN
jgi:hypothetical protein